MTNAGCGILRELWGTKFEFHCPEPAHSAVAIAVGARANSPEPALPTAVRKLVTEAMTGCAKITVVRIDGRPAVAGSTVFSTTAKTQQNFDADQVAFLKRVSEMLRDAKAQAPEANVLGALGLAAAAAGPGGSVVLLDSGIQTTDPIDFRKNELPTKKPKVIAEALRHEGLLPDLNQRSVILSGIGYSARPQGALDDPNRTFVVELWREIVIASGVKNPIVLADPNTAESIIKSPAVGVVDFPVRQIHLECDAVAVLPDDNEVGFIPDQAEFRNPGAARAVFRPFAEFLNTNPAATVEIEGFVAHYGHGNLSQQRADRVKQELTELGVKNSMTATGKGWGPFPDPSADPDPRFDQLNRRVTISVKCP
jgi:outer membrane protein OmpA-like peptidoglycan-associated protein